MLRYLTHKLRTQSLNETETYHVKTDDDRDSGTESDDEGAEIEELQKYMESIIHLDSRHNEQQRRSRRQQQNPPPSHQQQQVTSGEEGDVGPASARHRHHQQQQHQHHRPRRRPPGGNPNRRSPDDAALLDSALPSDSDHNFDHHSSEEELEVINSGGGAEKRKWVGGGCEDEDERLLVCCPVQFRTSPPAHAHKPGGKCLRQANIPPHELCSVSPRKRHRRTPTAIQQRPCLDFEKMQQMKENLQWLNQSGALIFNRSRPARAQKHPYV